MSRADLIARRYAEAFFKCLEGMKKDPSSYIESLDSLASVFEIEHARKILVSPVVPAAIKKSLMDGLARAQNVDQVLRNFIYIILEKNRIDVLPFIAAEFQQLIDSKAGVLRAEVSTPVALSPQEIDGLKAGLTQKFKKNVEIIQKLDESVLGGMVVRVGNLVLDMSIRSKMEGLFQRIVV